MKVGSLIYPHFIENCDIDIDINKDKLENMDIIIAKDILENMDINIDIDRHILGKKNPVFGSNMILILKKKGANAQ